MRRASFAIFLIIGALFLGILGLRLVGRTKPNLAQGETKTVTIKGFQARKEYVKDVNYYILQVNIDNRFLVVITISLARETLYYFADSIEIKTNGLFLNVLERGLRPGFCYSFYPYMYSLGSAPTPSPRYAALFCCSRIRASKDSALFFSISSIFAVSSISTPDNCLNARSARAHARKSSG